MAEPRIKWRDKDIEKLRKTVKNFNAKITRLLKKNPALADVLPSKVSFAEIRKSIDNRKDFNNTVNSLKRFSRKGAEELVTNKRGLTVTKWEKKEIQIKTNIVNRRRKQKLARLNPTPMKGTMKTEQEMNLSPKNVNFENRTRDSWEAFKKAVHKQAAAGYERQREIQYKKNYEKAVDNQIGAYGDILKHLAERAGYTNLYEWYSDDQNIQIDHVYSATERTNKLIDIINAFAKHGVIMTKAEAEQFQGYQLVEGKITLADADAEARYYEVDNSWLDDVE